MEKCGRMTRQTKPRVLVVDDDELLRRAIGRILKDEFELTFARDGGEALPMILEMSFDSVLSDIEMPGMCGDELYEAVLAEDPEKAKAIVFMTGGSTRPKAKDLLGRIGFLRKPIDPTALRRALHAAARTSG